MCCLLHFLVLNTRVLGSTGRDNRRLLDLVTLLPSSSTDDTIDSATLTGLLGSSSPSSPPVND
jgi:hypothetical protein